MTLNEILQRALRPGLTVAAMFGVALAGPTSAANTYATLDEWSARAAMPFALDSSDAATKEFNARVDKIVASLGRDVELLGFGEALHGGEDILTVRNRFFKRLVTEHGYSAISIESTFTRAWLVNEYVAGRGPASYDGLLGGKGFGQGVGEVEANRELVEWMRAYNADPAHEVKLSFYGFDIPTATTGIEGPGPTLRFPLAYLKSIDKQSGEEHQRKVEALLAQIKDWENPAAWADNTKSPGLSAAATSLRIAIEDLITELRTRRPELVAKSSRERYLDALQGALVARQVLNFHAALARKSGEPVAGPRGVRDALMADNLLYAVERERGRGKVMAFAHNGHLQRGKSMWPCCGQSYGQNQEVFTWWPAGAQLNDKLAGRYAVIGSGVGASEANGIGQPEAGTLEGRLTKRPGAALFIPTQQGHGLPTAEVSKLPTRTGSMKNLTYTSLIPQSFSDFDYLCVVDSTPYSRGAPPLYDWNAPAAETR